MLAVKPLVMRYRNNRKNRLLLVFIIFIISLFFGLTELLVLFEFCANQSFLLNKNNFLRRALEPTLITTTPKWYPTGSRMGVTEDKEVAMVVMER